MIARTHDVAAIIGLTITVAIVSPLQPLTFGTMIAALIANQLGAIAPDIDQPTAPFWRTISVGKLFGRFFGRIMGGHRFLTHSLLGLALMGVAVHLLLTVIHPIMPSVQMEYVWWAFIIGMVSHLVMDSFTKEGVPWLLPIPVKFGFPPLRRFRITTGKKLEKFVILPLLVALLVVIFMLYYDIFVELLKNRVTS